MRLETHNVSLIRSGQLILNKVNCSFRPGELVGVLGRNGAGKTSLVKTLAGLLLPTEGVVALDGQPVSEMAPRDRARNIAYLAQDHVVHWPLTVERTVSLGAMPRLNAFERPGSVLVAQIEEAMSSCDVLRFRERSVHTLSGGELARVLLARLMAVGAPVMLADEPVACLDMEHQYAVMNLLKKAVRTGQSVVVVLHDLSLALRYCDRVILLHEGAIAADGASRDVLTPELVGRVFGVEVKRLKVGETSYLLPVSGE